MTAKTKLLTAPPDSFDLSCETLIIGAGACGLVAALSAREAGQDVLVIEADATPRGSTALSAGLIPAAGTRAQREAGIMDSALAFAQDIQNKAEGQNDARLVDALSRHAAEAVDWLEETHGLPFTVVTDFQYPGHSCHRMHGLPRRTGSELIDALRAACDEAGVMIACDRRASALFHAARTIEGVAVDLPDGTRETIGCKKLILACNGFGGNKSMVADHMPEIREALWFGHDGNRGEAVQWGRELGADLAHLGSYQGHGNVAHPHGILITWAVITEGGIQVNAHGKRFWNEAQGYSEAARAVLAQPGGVAYTIFDDRIAGIASQFEDFQRAQTAGAIVVSDTLEQLAEKLGLPPETTARTVSSLGNGAPCAFGRSFDQAPLSPPYCGVRVTGALFHTQGGVRTDGEGRVLAPDGTGFPNLFAGGGAACGVSGISDSGYLSGNGLLSAVTLGRRAGMAGA